MPFLKDLESEIRNALDAGKYGSPAQKFWSGGGGSTLAKIDRASPISRLRMKNMQRYVPEAKKILSNKEAVRNLPALTTGALPDMAARNQLPNTVQRWAEGKTSLTSKIPNYMTGQKITSAIVEPVVRGVLFGNPQETRLAKEGFSNLVADKPRSPEQAEALENLRKQQTVEFAGITGAVTPGKDEARKFLNALEQQRDVFVERLKKEVSPVIRKQYLAKLKSIDDQLVKYDYQNVAKGDFVTGPNLLKKTKEKIGEVGESVKKVLKDEGGGGKIGAYIPGGLEKEEISTILPKEETDRFLKDLKPNQKVGIIDYLRTPEAVLKKIGLEDESKLLRQKHDDYLKQLPQEINRITKWWEEAGRSPESSRKIFRVLDGAEPIDVLSDSERKVATEVQDYLADWADKLGLPKDKRIASYITHIFENDFIQKEFDPELAKIISDQVPGSVYDPFLQERLGKMGYIEDVFKALDAYTKRAVRKYHMDQALGPLKAAADKLDEESWKYVKRLGDRINMRPTEVDNLIDNFIKSTPVGYKFGQRPTANLSRKLRTMVYRGTLGLNVGSALKNLTQGVNTYAELGEKWTIVGYSKTAKELLTGGKELQEVGVLSDNFIQDRNITFAKGLAQKVDDSLWVLFDLAEKINRGGAYFGAKSRALNQGKTLEEAIQEGVETARKTQFAFGKIDTPVGLQSDIVSFLTQFQSYPVKQSEFLINMAKDKRYAGLFRWATANVLLVLAFGDLLNIDLKDAIPFSGVATGETKIGETPPIKLAKDVTSMALGGTDKYGQPITAGDIAKDVVPFIPAGVQAKKTIEGLSAYEAGKSVTPSGRTRYNIPQTLPNLFKTGLLGQYSTPEAREYFDKGKRPVGRIKKISSSGGGLKKL